ncbi:MAG: Asp-tRNA(Asn)/Glu-tRNA(Gln) amidotransferase subunit GatA [Planctomycetota bacterium]
MAATEHHTLTELRDAIAAGDLSPTDATAGYLDAIAQHNPTLNAYREVTATYAAARAADPNLAGPLKGVPIAIKDCMCHTEGTTACGSKMLEHYHSPFTATAVQRLEDAGAIVLGKSNMDEFAMGSSTENSAFGITKNPWDPDRVPGGSSGGAASAMAAGLAAATLGSDTGGSIRQPAALCGIVGFKPTYGRISRWGLVAFASSLDQIGTFTQTVPDAALLSSVMFGKDPKDSTTADVEVPAELADPAAIDQPLDKPTIGLPKQYMVEGANDPEVEQALQQAIDLYKSQGAELVEVDLPHTDFGIATYYVVATAECSSNLARFDGVHYGHRAADPDDLIDLYAKSRSEGFGDEVKRRIMLGTYALSSGYYDAYYNTALKVRRLIRRDFDAVFETCDAILCPTATGPAFKIGELTDDPLAMYLNDVYTVPASLAGLPGISLPAGFAERDGKPLPIGIQLIGRAFDEVTLFRLARQFEQNTDHGTKHPPLAQPA